MTTREQIFQEIEHVPESLLDELLEFVRLLKEKPQVLENKNASPSQLPDKGKAFLAYLESEEKWSEVYHRLAQS